MLFGDAARLAGRSPLSLAGQASVKGTLIAAVTKSGKLDPLIAELARRKARTGRYRAKRAAARRQATRASVG